MSTESRPHSLASVVALVVIPGTTMLLTALYGGVLGKNPATHLLAAIALGVMWHGLARRWLQKFSPQADGRLLRICLFTLFVAIPAANVVVFGSVAVAGFHEITWVQPVVAGFLGLFPLWRFYLQELQG